MSAPLKYIAAVALAVENFDRASRFYAETFDLKPAYENDRFIGYYVGKTKLMLKSGALVLPTKQPNPRITIEVADALAMQNVLHGKGIEVSDAVRDYDGFLVGSFIDSEGNKLWFCSAMK
jgi:predicted enzyme related to lactoylglutathione lyase